MALAGPRRAARLSGAPSYRSYGQDCKSIPPESDPSVPQYRAFPPARPHSRRTRTRPSRGRRRGAGTRGDRGRTLNDRGARL